jgi:hypothetical protein
VGGLVGAHSLPLRFNLLDELAQPGRGLFVEVGGQQLGEASRPLDPGVVLLDPAQIVDRLCSERIASAREAPTCQLGSASGSLQTSSEEFSERGSMSRCTPRSSSSPSCRPLPAAITRPRGCDPTRPPSVYQR